MAARTTPGLLPSKRVSSEANMSPLSWANLTSNKFKTTALINLAGIMERMDEQILPALYNFIGHSFQATPSQLGTLTLCRAMVQALSSPIGGLSGNVPVVRSECSCGSLSVLQDHLTCFCRSLLQPGPCDQHWVRYVGSLYSRLQCVSLAERRLSVLGNQWHRTFLSHSHWPKPDC